MRSLFLALCLLSTLLCFAEFSTSHAFAESVENVQKEPVSQARKEPLYTVLGVHESESQSKADASRASELNFESSCNVTREKEEADIESEYRTEGRHQLAKIWDLSKPWKTEPVLYIVVNRDGHLQSSAMAHSSGDAAVDDEALKKVQSAFPLKSFPSGIKRKTVDFLVSPSIAKVLLNPPSKLERKRTEMAYSHQSHAWIKQVTNHFNAKFREQKFKKVELVRVYIVIYEETGEIILKKIDQSSCNPAFDQQILDLIQPPLPKATVISPSRVLRMYLDFKSWI